MQDEGTQVQIERPVLETRTQPRGTPSTETQMTKFINIKAEGIAESDEKHEKSQATLLLPESRPTSQFAGDQRENKIFLEEEDLHPHIEQRDLNISDSQHNIQLLKDEIEAGIGTVKDEKEPISNNG